MHTTVKTDIPTNMHATISEQAQLLQKPNGFTNTSLEIAPCSPRDFSLVIQTLQNQGRKRGHVTCQ